MSLYVVDGQGGGIGRSLIERLRVELPQVQIVAVGSNAMATASMLKAGATAGATGENAVIYCCSHAREQDVIIGPIGIVLANSMLGELTPKMAQAVSESRAYKVLIPVQASRSHAAIVDSIKCFVIHLFNRSPEVDVAFYSLKFFKIYFYTF